MKAIQIDRYSKAIQTVLREIPVPEIKDNEVLIKVKAAAVNPLELLILTGSLRLIQDHSMPLTLGNECSGIVDQTGSKVRKFQKGDLVYTRLPIKKIGAFAEYVAVNENAVARMPKGYDFATASAIPLTGLTAYQGMMEELEVEAGKTLLIPGGSGSFGQMAVPIAKELGLQVMVTGGERAKKRFLILGADRYLDYKKENYWECLKKVDYVIDTLGAGEFANELSVLKRGGKLLSLKAGPNRMFALKNRFPFWKRLLFGMAGAKYDREARKQGKEYHFLFVRSDGAQLKKVTEIVEKNRIQPDVDPHRFSLEQTNEALRFVKEGSTNGKVVIQIN